jgi:hypothetical protein
MVHHLALELHDLLLVEIAGKGVLVRSVVTMFSYRQRRGRTIGRT